MTQLSGDNDNDYDVWDKRKVGETGEQSNEKMLRGMR